MTLASSWFSVYAGKRLILANDSIDTSWAKRTVNLCIYISLFSVVSKMAKIY